MDICALNKVYAALFKKVFHMCTTRAHTKKKKRYTLPVSRVLVFITTSYMSTPSFFTTVPMRFRILIGTGVMFLLVLTPTVFTESLPIIDSESAGFQTASADATLSSLTLTDVPFNEEFSPERTMYTAETSMGEVTVLASTAHDAAIVTIDPSDSNAEEDGHQVSLGEGSTIGVTVTAEDGTTEIYTVTVTKPTAPRTTDETVPLIESEPESDTQTSIGGTVTYIVAIPRWLRVILLWDTSSTTGVTGWQYRYVAQSSNTWSDWTNVPSQNNNWVSIGSGLTNGCLLYTSPSPRD